MIWLRWTVYSLGETTTRSNPSGGAPCPPAWPTTFPKESPKACVSMVHGVFTHSRPIIAFSEARDSSSDISFTTTVTPEGWPPTDIGVGPSDIKRDGIGLGASTGHFPSSSARQICCARSKHSGSSWRYIISTRAVGWPVTSLINMSRCNWRGPKSFRNRSSFSSASLVRAFASALCAFALAISACAIQVLHWPVQSAIRARWCVRLKTGPSRRPF
jgi:hypothetical protein